MSELRKDIVNRFTSYIKNNTEFREHTPLQNNEIVKRLYNQPVEITFYKGLDLRCIGTVEYSLRIFVDSTEIVYYRKDKMKLGISEEEHFQLSLVKNVKISYQNIQDLIDIYLKNGYNRGFSIRIDVYDMGEDEFLF